MKALVFLCQKSIVLREQVNKREDEACDVEQAIYNEEENADDIMSDEDDDEDYDCEEFADNDLYDSKLDNVDEVLVFRDAISHLEKTNAQMYSYLMSTLDANEQAVLSTAITKAMEYQQAQ